MTTSILDIAPFIPGDQALAQSALPDKAITLINRSARLTGQLSPLTLATLSRHMLAINSYCSNLIEGNATRPHEIRAAQRGDYSRDPAKRDLQLESLAHMQVQQWLREKNPDLDTLFSTEFVRALHREFYTHVPQNLWALKHHERENKTGDAVDTVIPGEWRRRDVIVGRHVPPPAAALILYTAFLYGEIERSQALALCAMPERSARRLLSQLKSEGLLSESSSKSPLRWEIPEHAEEWYFPRLAPSI